LSDHIAVVHNKGVIEKIPYLQELGITRLNCCLLFQFDVQDCPPGKVNYWDHSPVLLFLLLTMDMAQLIDPLKTLD
jgi:pullulanase/glycogen debranching enzyme